MNAQFSKCFLDMRRKNRYSVLNLDEQPTIKDGYLIALARGEQPPSEDVQYSKFYFDFVSHSSCLCDNKGK